VSSSDSNAVLRFIVPADQILELLIAERDKLNRAIEALQGPAKHGRRPKNAGAAATAVPTNHRGGMSPAARKAQSRRMKAFWAKRRKEAAK
jgi:hypothetical protein